MCMSRPKRKAAEDAVERIQKILAWEGASESSKLFKACATAIDAGMAARAAETAARLQSNQFWPGARQGLTQRESEILSLVVTGLSNRGIAAKLMIGEETVKTHLSSIYRKLGVGDRTSAAATALREGIFQ